MRWRVVVFVAALLAESSHALAQSHEQICIPATVNGKNVSIVSKNKLAKAILNQNSDWQALYINADADAGTAQYRPQWRRIFTDPNFCNNNPGCLAPNSKTKKMDDSAAQDTLTQLRFTLADFIQTPAGNKQYYWTANPTIGTDYLLGSDTTNPIFCIGPELPPVAKAAPGISLPIRLRASSDDLDIDATSQKSEFKALKPATVSFTRDAIANKTSASLQGALGYPIPLDFGSPAYATSSSAEVVPYVASTESYSKVDGKPATYGDTNNWAVGALFDASVNFVDAASVNNVFMVKPQYLWNTKDRSEIGSLQLIWQPWTQNLTAGGPPPINSVFPLGLASAGYHAQILFDLRFDSGLYTNKGNDPTTIPQHTSFDRAGSKFGFAVSTPALGPYVTLNVTETLLDGFAGQVPYISLFNTALSYYFDSTGNVGVTASYTNGRDENTAEYAQTYTLGFSAKF